MQTWLFVIALMVLPGATIAGPAPAGSSAPHRAHASLASIARDLREGDVPALARIYRHPPDPATRVLAAIALERIHFRLDEADEDAAICEHELIDSRPDIALFCADIANGDMRLSGHAHAADLDERDIVRRFAGRVPRARLDAMRRYVASRRKIPPMQVHKPAGTFVIPLGRWPRSDMGTIKVEANGAELPLIVDTGSSGITLDAKWARELGVRMTGNAGTVGGVISRGIPVRHGILDRISFAGVTMRHVPVIVVPGRQRLIGIDILRRLGVFRLGRDGITVYGEHAERPACRQPMLIGSNVWGTDMHLLTALPIDGNLRTVLVDSGTSFFLAASRNAMDELGSGHNDRLLLHGMGPHGHHARVNRAHVTVVVGHQPFRVDMPVFKDARLPWNYIVGSGALRYMDFYFDFERHHTCLLPHD